jgi:hypothetical protein
MNDPTQYSPFAGLLTCTFFSFCPKTFAFADFVADLPMEISSHFYPLPSVANTSCNFTYPLDEIEQEVGGLIFVVLKSIKTSSMITPSKMLQLAFITNG